MLTSQESGRIIPDMQPELVRTLKALPATPRARVRVALAMLGRTQTEMAFEVGIDKSLLSNALNGYRSLTADQQEGIAEFLGVPRPVLFPAA